MPAVRFTLDEWMIRLHGIAYDDTDYPPAAAQCRDLIWDTAVQVLRSGTPVILDWNLFSRARRAEWVERADAAGFNCILHHVAVRLETAISQAEARTDPTAHRLSAEGMHHVADQLLQEPTSDKGFILDVVQRR